MTSVLIPNLPEHIVLLLQYRAKKTKTSVAEQIVMILENESSSITVSEWLELVATTPDVLISADEILAIIHEGRNSR